MAERFRTTQSGEHSEPKTVLGFYASVLAIVEVGVVAAIAVLASQKELRHLIEPVLIFGGVVLVALIGVVVTINVRAPMKLQLGKVTGREYIEYEQMTLGNSITGEYIERVPRSVTSGAELSPPTTPETDKDEDIRKLGTGGDDVLNA
jgi:hypothetical protein